MKRKYLLASLCGLFLFGSLMTSEASDAVYQDEVKAYPYVGTWNDKALYLERKSIFLEDVFQDGLAVQVRIFDDENGKVHVETVHLRMADDGRAWVLRSDGWYAVTEDSGNIERKMIRIIREDMGSDEHRKAYITRIGEIWEHKAKLQEEAARKEENADEKATEEESSDIEYKPVELESVVPGNVVTNVDVDKEKSMADGVKEKGQVQKESDVKNKDKQPEQVEIVIEEHPVVEIISQNNKRK